MTAPECGPSTEKLEKPIITTEHNKYFVEGLERYLYMFGTTLSPDRKNQLDYFIYDAKKSSRENKGLELKHEVAASMVPIFEYYAAGLPHEDELEPTDVRVFDSYYVNDIVELFRESLPEMGVLAGRIGSIATSDALQEHAA